MKRSRHSKAILLQIVASLLLWSGCVQAQETDPYAKERELIWDKDHYNYTPWTAEQKLFALSKFWAEAKRNFVYKDRVGAERWDSLYQQLLRPAVETKNDREFHRLMNRFCSFLQDGHTEIYSNRICWATNSGFDSLNWTTDYVGGKFFISSIKYPKAKEIPAGSEIIEVNGMPVKEYYEKTIRPRVAASTEAYRLQRGAEILLEDLYYTRYTIKLQLPDKQYRTITMHHNWAQYGEEEDNLSTVPNRIEWEFFKFKWLNDQIAYIKLETFDDDSICTLFENHLPELQKRAKKLIIDIRQNGGGNTAVGARILSRLTTDTLLVGSKWSTRTYNAAYAAWGQGLEPKDTVGDAQARLFYQNAHDQAFYHDTVPMQFSYPAKRERLIVPTVILTGVGTLSAAEDFLILAENQKHITTLGQTTGGSTGQPIFFELIPGMTCRICTKKDTYPDGREFVGKGIEPDIPVALTLDAYKQERDITLEEAVRFLKKAKP